MSPISTWSVAVPRKMARTVSRGFNKVVSKVVPQDQVTLYALAQRTDLPSVDLIESRRGCKIEKSFQI